MTVPAVQFTIGTHFEVVLMNIVPGAHPQVLFAKTEKGAVQLLQVPFNL